MKPEPHSFQILIEQLTSRLDNHGADIRDMKNKLDSKIDLVIAKLDNCKTHDYGEHCKFSERLTTMEAEKGIVGKALTVLAGLLAGFGGGWFSKNL